MNDALNQSTYLKACRGEATSHTPIWLNRQAGRYMPEYRKLKGNTPGLEWFTTPDLMAQVTIDAQRILGVDAAILFADLLPMLVPMGLRLDYRGDTGPIFANPIRTPDHVKCLRPIEAADHLGYIATAIRAICSGLPNNIPLIGFAGAPFTLASYAIEGRSSKHYLQVKSFMYKHPQAWDALMTKIVQAVINYVQLQIDAGVQSIQIFDSWVGCLGLDDYKTYVMPHTAVLFKAIGGQVPTIYFGTNSSHLLEAMYSTNPDFMALDWRIPIQPAWERLGCNSIQGNLDPLLLFADWPLIEQRTKELLDQVGGKSGHIFNLGHGIMPETPVDNVKRLVNLVQEYTARSSASPYY